MTTALDLHGPLREHLLTGSTLTGLVGQRIHFAKAPADTSAPYVLYKVRLARHEYGFGGPDVGQTSDVVLDLHIVTEDASSDTSALSDIAAALHVLMLAWSSPAGWSIRNIELEQERADAFGESGRFYETFTMSYRVLLESA